MPDGARVKGDTVTWPARGKTKTGKLSPDTGRVLVHSETWTARYKDENGKTVAVSTKCRDRAAANRILAKLENEVIQIRTGAVSRRDIDVTRAGGESLQKHLADFFVSQMAKGVGRRQIADDKSKLLRLFPKRIFANWPTLRNKNSAVGSSAASKGGSLTRSKNGAVGRERSIRTSCACEPFAGGV